MKILVLSDSHGDYPQLFRAHEAAAPVESTIHLGDGAEDARLLEEVLRVPVVAVAGNCDRLSRLPTEAILKLEGHTLLVTHGHPYHVKAGLALLARRASEVGAGIVLYGHTHRAFREEREGILFVNPGPVAGGTGSFAVVTLTPGKAPAAEFFRLSPEGSAPFSPSASA